MYRTRTRRPMASSASATIAPMRRGSPEATSSGSSLPGTPKVTSAPTPPASRSRREARATSCSCSQPASVTSGEFGW